MKTLHKQIKRYAIVGLAILSCNACVKNDFKGNGGEETGNAENFSFVTTQQSELTVNYQYPYKMEAYIEAYTENPLVTDEYGNLLKKEGLKPPFAKGYTDGNGKLSLPIELPATASEIYIYSPTLGAPTLTTYTLGNSPSETAFAAPQTIPTRSGDSYYSKWEKQQIKFEKEPLWDEKGRPENLLGESLSFDEKMLEVINATIPKGEKLDLRFCSVSEIELSEDAHVKLYHAFDKTSRNNALAYYTFTGDQPNQVWINSHLTLLFPNLSSEALDAGDGVQLMYNDGTALSDVFPAGSKIGFVLLVDAWHNRKVKTNVNVMYSDNAYNSYNLPGQIKANRPQMAAFYTDDTKEKLVLSFEDQPWTESPGSPYVGDFCDNVFVLHADPASALPDDIDPGKDPEKPDYGMEFRTFGTLAFEDVWPYKGDYDLNDVVIGYQSKYYMNSEYDLTAFEDVFTFLNDGAQYQNGFGFQLETSASNIASCEIISSYTCPGQGLDPELEQATVMLFDNGKQIPKGTTFTVKVVYKTPVVPYPKKHNTAPYNPFITVCEAKDDGVAGYLANGRKEVHPVNYAPTAKMNTALFNTGHDLSEPEKGKYYVSDSSFPFALNLSEVDRYIVPEETNRIDNIYPYFKSWVTSGGTLYKDWYDRPKSE